MRTYHRNREAIYPYDPWMVRETHFDIESNYRDETIFAQGNGYVGIRANLEEGYNGPKGTSFSATYINGFYESYPILYPEGGYGFAHTGETMINVTDSKGMKVFLEGEEFSLMSGTVHHYERKLDLKKGVVTRQVIWESPKGKKAEITFLRLVSFKRPHLILYSTFIKPLNFSGEIRLISRIDGNVTNGNETDDVRVSSHVSGKVLRTLDLHVGESGGWIKQQTERSRLTLLCAVLHEFIPENSGELSMRKEEEALVGEISFFGREGEPLQVNKYVAYLDSRSYPEEQLPSTAENLLMQARADGRQVLMREQEEYLASFWAEADIEIDGDEALQQGVRFNAFHLLQSVGRNGFTSIGAKGLTGEGYEGHYFWDTEIYILPFFLYTQPELAKSLLLFRYHLLDAARKRARELKHKGALFPWRTIDGPECSAFFPAGTAQYHINADVIYALKRYVEGTGDEEFLFSYGSEMLVETARFWVDRGTFSPAKGGKFCIHTVTGPDEYMALVDNNAFTNYMARMNLEYAVRTLARMKEVVPDRYRELVDKLNLADGEMEWWRKASEEMYLPYSEELGIIPQDDTFLQKERLMVDELPADEIPLLLHRHYLDIYRYQVCKQPDALLAMFLLRELFTVEEIRRNYDYYEPITTHDSSLSPAIFSILANEIGYEQKAYEYFMQTARMDLDDYNQNVKDGIHTASMAGTWLAIVQGFGGVKFLPDGLHATPHLPAQWKALRFTLRYRGRKLMVTLAKEECRFKLIEGDPIEITYREEKFTLTGEEVFSV